MKFKSYPVIFTGLINSGKTQLATELEYTAASYGARDLKGVVQSAEFVNNLRLLLAAYYFF